MCEWCGKVDESQATELGPEEADELICEGESEYEPGHMCGAPARYRSKDRFVEMHICERHMQAVKADMDEGLGDLLQSAALAESVVVRPIRSQERCEDLDFARGTECGEPAGYAYIVTQETYCCAKHKDAK